MQRRADFIARVSELSGIADDEAVRRAVGAATSVLLEQLAEHDRAWLADCLPEGLRSSPGPLRPAETLQDFYERVASREGVELGFAVEHAQSVCSAFGECLSDDARARMTRLLPDALIELFATREPLHAPLGVHEHMHSRPARRTLSEGRAHSSQPLSESAQPAQADSVARTDNPHADTKLSSSPGTTQEREHETLAESDRARTNR